MEPLPQRTILSVEDEGPPGSARRLWDSRVCSLDQQHISISWELVVRKAEPQTPLLHLHFTKIPRRRTCW